jgi:carboxymethylenebutenolidase
MGSENVSYGEGLRAYLAEPETGGPHPTVVLLHERYGLFQHTLDLADKFARAGYVCLAPDLYSRVEDQTELLKGNVSIPLHDWQVRDDLAAAYTFLKERRSVDPTRLALMGVCLTGRFAVTVGAYRTDLKALVNLYCGAGEKEWGPNEYMPERMEDLFARISAPILGIFGERDHVIPIPYVLRWRNGLEQANKAYEISLYPDMPHGWLNDRMPGRYRAEGAERAWNQTLDFLQRSFAGAFNPRRVVWRFDSDIAVDYDPNKNVRLE